jgi:hypothetical protein
MSLVASFLDHHFASNPVDASFVGIEGFDRVLPRADASAGADEKRALLQFQARLPAKPVDMDDRILAGEIALALCMLETRPRRHNPAWYTGEVLFGLVSLLLPQSEPVNIDAIEARLLAVPDFLTDGLQRLKGQGAPVSATLRMRREAEAAASFMDEALRTHPAWHERLVKPAQAAATALRAFARALEDHPDAEFAAGPEMIDLILRRVHALPFGADEALARARTAFDTISVALEEAASRLDPDLGWREQIARLSTQRVAEGALQQAFQHHHEAALAGAHHLMTPAVETPLQFPALAPWFSKLASQSYFLSYRCPPAMRPQARSVYWMPPKGDMELATLKSVHAIHHGSIGHHTQNARARVAMSRFGRMAGTDCAMGIAFLSAGTMVEGWSCYAQGLAREIPGFHTPAEELLLLSFERRNAASVLVDLNIHLKRWSLSEAARFYREDAGFAPERVDGEIARNAMFPGSRAMYHLGVAEIKAARMRWRGDLKGFHDGLISYGHVPVRLALEEMGAA